MHSELRCVLPASENLVSVADQVLQQDNDLKHTAKNTQE